MLDNGYALSIKLARQFTIDRQAEAPGNSRRKF